MKSRPIIEVSYGIASSYDDGIEIHKDIQGSLRTRILKHEMKHDKNTSYTKKDFRADFDSSNSYMKESIVFSLKHPSAWIGFFPFMYSYYFKIMTFNWSAMIPFLYFGGIFTLFWWSIFRTNPLYTGICYVSVIILMNLILLGLTHRSIKKSGVEY